MKYMPAKQVTSLACAKLEAWTFKVPPISPGLAVTALLASAFLLDLRCLYHGHVRCSRVRMLQPRNPAKIQSGRGYTPRCSLKRCAYPKLEVATTIAKGESGGGYANTCPRTDAEGAATLHTARYWRQLRK
jgi:hypothetical protein